MTQGKDKKSSTKAKKSDSAKNKDTGHEAGEAQSARLAPTGLRENRVDHRVPVQLLVDYHSNGNYLFDFCRDLGVGGVFIQTTTPLAKGSNVDLTFTIPDSKETLRARGEVIWVQGASVSGSSPGMGVQFREFNTAQRETLQGFVERYSKINPTEGGATNLTPITGKKSA
jgi:type IV pilus assembly protein PilZ